MPEHPPPSGGSSLIPGRPPTPADIEIRLQCLDLAVRAGPGGTLELARQFYEFTTGNFPVEKPPAPPPPPPQQSERGR